MDKNMPQKINRICLSSLKFGDFAQSKNLLVSHGKYTAAVRMMPTHPSKGCRFLVDGELIDSLSGVKRKIEELAANPWLNQSTELNIKDC